jgi:hypothetical protein
MRACTHVRTHTHITHTYAHARKHTHTYTHTPSPPPPLPPKSPTPLLRYRDVDTVRTHTRTTHATRIQTSINTHTDTHTHNNLQWFQEAWAFLSAQESGHFWCQHFPGSSSSHSFFLLVLPGLYYPYTVFLFQICLSVGTDQPLSYPYVYVCSHLPPVRGLPIPHTATRCARCLGSRFPDFSDWNQPTHDCSHLLFLLLRLLPIAHCFSWLANKQTR